MYNSKIKWNSRAGRSEQPTTTLYVHRIRKGQIELEVLNSSPCVCVCVCNLKEYIETYIIELSSSV